jgi:hypothetical protein
MDDEMKVDRTKKLFSDLDSAIQSTLDGDQHFVNMAHTADQFIIEDVGDDNVPDPVFGKFLPDVNEIEQADGYDEFVGAQMTLT